MKLRKIRHCSHSPVSLKIHNGCLPRLTQGLMDYTSALNQHQEETRLVPAPVWALSWAVPQRTGTCTADQPCHRAVVTPNLAPLQERMADWYFSLLPFSRGQNKHLGLVAHFPASCSLPHCSCCCTVAAQSHFKPLAWTNSTDCTQLMFPSCRKICSENKWKIINANFTFFISKAKWHHISESLSKPKILFEPALIMNKLQVQAVLLHKCHQ